MARVNTNTNREVKGDYYESRPNVVKGMGDPTEYPEEGRIVFNENDTFLYYNNGTEWVKIGQAPDNTFVPQNDSVSYLGWESFADTTITEANPLVVEDGSTATLTNAANIVINQSAPIDSTGLYDSTTNKITPLKENDYLIMSMRFQAKISATNGYLDYSLDIGAPVLPNFPDGLIFPETKTFPKGAGVEHNFNVISNGYAGNIFSTNGGIPKITAVGGDISIYNIEFQISIVNKGK